MTFAINTGAGLALGLALLVGGPALAADEVPIEIEALFSELPDDLAGKRMTVVEVTYAPGAGSTPHRHPGSVFAYVLAGSVRSQLASEDAPTVYEAGESWYEPPGARHIVSENASAEEPARLLAILIGDDDSELVLPDED